MYTNHNVSLKGIFILRAWLLLSGIVCALICGGIAVFWPSACAVAALLLLISGAGLWFFIPRRIASYSYRTRGEKIVIHYGVLFKKTVLIPRVRLLYCQRITTPLCRKFGLCIVRLLISRKYAVIPFITSAQADEIRQSEGESYA